MKKLEKIVTKGQSYKEMKKIDEKVMEEQSYKVTREESYEETKLGS